MGKREQLRHDQTRSVALPLRGTCSTGGRDLPLSDDEGDSRGRGKDKIVSHIQPSKNVNSYARANSRPITTDVVAQASLKKNRGVFLDQRAQYNPYDKAASSSNRTRVASGDKNTNNAIPQNNQSVPTRISHMNTSRASADQVNENSGRIGQGGEMHRIQQPQQNKKYRIPKRPSTDVDHDRNRKNSANLQSIENRNKSTSTDSVPVPLDRIELIQPPSKITKPTTATNHENRVSDVKRRKIDSSTVEKQSTSRQTETAASTSKKIVAAPEPQKLSAKSQHVFTNQNETVRKSSTSHSEKNKNSKYAPPATIHQDVASTSSSQVVMKEYSTQDKLKAIACFESMKRMSFVLTVCDRKFEACHQLTYKDKCSIEGNPLAIKRKKSAQNESPVVPNIACTVDSKESTPGGSSFVANASHFEKASIRSSSIASNSRDEVGAQRKKSNVEVKVESGAHIERNTAAVEGTEMNIRVKVEPSNDMVNDETAIQDQKPVVSAKSCKEGPSYTTARVKTEAPLSLPDPVPSNREIPFNLTAVKKEVMANVDDDIIFVAHVTPEYKEAIKTDPCPKPNVVVENTIAAPHENDQLVPASTVPRMAVPGMFPPVVYDPTRPPPAPPSWVAGYPQPFYGPGPVMNTVPYFGDVIDYRQQNYQTFPSPQEHPNARHYSRNLAYSRRPH